MQAAPSSVLMVISLPGMGKMSSPLECTQASASCPGVQPFLSAISFTFSTSLKFCRDVSKDVLSCHSGAGRTLALPALSSPGTWPQDPTSWPCSTSAPPLLLMLCSAERCTSEQCCVVLCKHLQAMLAYGYCL